MPAGAPEGAGHRLRGRERSALVAAQNDADDRRVYRRERGREGAHEDVEPARDEVRLRRGLPDSGRARDVHRVSRAGTAAEASVPQLCAAHELDVRLWAGVARGHAEDDPEAAG